MLGEHCKQAGSAVHPDRLRFDFTHFSAVTPDELQQVERHVNSWVCENAAVETVLMDLDEAKDAGAMAMFGEKYDERVRTVRIGADSLSSVAARTLSVQATSPPGWIVSEGACGGCAPHRGGHWVGGAGNRSRRPRARPHGGLAQDKPAQLGERIQGMQARLKDTEAELSELRSQLAASQSADLLGQVVECEGLKTLSAVVLMPSPATSKSWLRNYAISCLMA